MIQTLWEIKPVDRVVRIPGMPPVTVPVYPSLLVPEEQFAQSLRNEELNNTDFMNRLVAFCLKHRGVLASDIPDEKIIASTPRPLAEALFCLFYHGPTGKPVDPLNYVYDPKEELGNESSPSTGVNSAGNFSDGIQVADTLPLTGLSTVPQNLPSMQPESIATPA